MISLTNDSRWHMWGRNEKLEKIFKGHLPNGDSINTDRANGKLAILEKYILDNVSASNHLCELLKRELPIPNATGCKDNICADQHKTYPSLSASMMVLSTICCNC